jgi:hypothetical protein
MSPYQVGSPHAAQPQLTVHTPASGTKKKFSLLLPHTPAGVCWHSSPTLVWWQPHPIKAGCGNTTRDCRPAYCISHSSQRPLCGGVQISHPGSHPPPAPVQQNLLGCLRRTTCQLPYLPSTPHRHTTHIHTAECPAVQQGAEGPPGTAQRVPGGGVAANRRVEGRLAQLPAAPSSGVQGPPCRTAAGMICHIVTLLQKHITAPTQHHVARPCLVSTWWSGCL